MNPDLKEAYTRLIDEIFSQSAIQPQDIPNIDIYMDQLTTFMDERLRSFTRDPEHDKVLTKTMINNYTKNDLLPPPNKKKYSRDHLILLIFIFYLKRNFSIEDISRFIKPLKAAMKDAPEEMPSLADIYRETLSWSVSEADDVREGMDRLFEKSQKTFADVEEPMRGELRRFAFLALLANEVHIRQVLIEKLLDLYREEK